MRNYALLLIALTLALFSPGIARACWCNTPATQSQFFKNAGAVFSGKVAEVKEVEDEKGRFIGHKVKVLVERSWKFVREREITFFNSGLCSYPAEEGERYLFYTIRPNEKEFRVEGKCSIQSAILSYSTKNLEDLELREELELPKDKKSLKRNDWLFPERN